MYLNIDVGRFIAIIILVVLAWNIVQAIQNALNNLYLKLTNSDANEVKPWLTIALIYTIITAVVLYLTQFKIDEILGTTMKFT